MNALSVNISDKFFSLLSLAFKYFFVYLPSQTQCAGICNKKQRRVRRECAIYRRDVYLTFYLWHTELRNFKIRSHGKAAVDVHGYVVCTALSVCLSIWVCNSGRIYTYQRGPLRCLSLTEGNAKALYAG